MTHRKVTRGRAEWRGTRGTSIDATCTMGRAGKYAEPEICSEKAEKALEGANACLKTSLDLGNEDKEVLECGRKSNRKKIIDEEGQFGRARGSQAGAPGPKHIPARDGGGGLHTARDPDHAVDDILYYNIHKVSSCISHLL